MDSNDTLHIGIVFKRSLGSYDVKINGNETVVCSISSKLRKQLVYGVADKDALRRTIVAVDEAKADPVAIGDRVLIDCAEPGKGVIREILPRKSKFSRRAAGPVPVEQVIAANLDQVVVVMAAAQPAPSWHAMDCYLVDAEAAALPALICLTKADLLRDKDVEKVATQINVYRQIGYEVLLTSAPRGEGIADLKQALAGRISVLVGKSGVGKSTLLNTIEPGLALRVSEVSSSRRVPTAGKGRHTTTHLEMFTVEMGDGAPPAHIVDTPGMKELGIWNKPDDMASLFPEMRPYLGQCRFGADCSHSHEPGCAIKEAVEEGMIAERRYQNYLRVK
jgi:ribosome biogenesis GTPase / thiamine phosphate phosphatase